MATAGGLFASFSSKLAASSLSAVCVCCVHVCAWGGGGGEEKQRERERERERETEGDRKREIKMLAMQTKLGKKQLQLPRAVAAVYSGISLIMFTFIAYAFSRASTLCQEPPLDKLCVSPSYVPFCLAQTLT